MDYQGFFHGGCLYLLVSLDRTGELTLTLQERCHKRPARPQKALTGAAGIYVQAVLPEVYQWNPAGLLFSSAKGSWLKCLTVPLLSLNHCQPGSSKD